MEGSNAGAIVQRKMLQNAGGDVSVSGEVADRRSLSRPMSYPGKRLMDVVGAGVGLLLLLPVLGVVAVAVWMTMGCPILFVQERPGFKGRPFRIFKFRTMTGARNENGQLLPDGDRLSRFGRFIRTTSLDELPELWNVLRGEMSLVGPRPLLMRYLPFFSPRERLRFEVRPGITGLAQVSGRNNLSWDERLELDAGYVEGLSMRKDFWILLKTASIVLLREGAAADTNVVESSLDEERSGSLADCPAQEPGLR